MVNDSSTFSEKETDCNIPGACLFPKADSQAPPAGVDTSSLPVGTGAGAAGIVRTGQQDILAAGSPAVLEGAGVG